MKFADFENNDISIYSDDEYQQITGGKYGKEIFVPYNDNLEYSNGNANKNQQHHQRQQKLPLE